MRPRSYTSSREDVLILGATGSIGEQALDVIARSAELRSPALGRTELGARCSSRPAHRGPRDRARRGRCRGRRQGLGLERHRARRRGGHPRADRPAEPDVVLNAIVGSAGLGPTIVALTEGIELALANKESLVVGGELVTALAEATGARILPVDSEHSALHQLIASEPPGVVERLVLTASGGPFRGRTDLDGVTPRGGPRPPDLGDGRARSRSTRRR